MTFLNFSFTFDLLDVLLLSLEFEIQTLCFCVVNGLIKGEIEKPNDQYLGLICDDLLTCRCLNLNMGHFGGCTFTFIFIKCEESCLLIS
jgi:hypothetical protein